ncbi:hypothetical protein KZO01_09270 [Kurthia zopfii]|uniref:Uncharacterized protein n=1 Tax=Kurthia zopfii TaxID=1650 RepID=A0A2U3ACU7_9BACL|nr:DUF6583 family protein [Kurthia zopfii]PWI22335.1 hypothetical protein DF281_07620 [Kurthia zopfii]TDR38297.1 hypothetical protein DFR61_11727 [Kurthia zopfii]STX08664.1 Uncharacterised protein [Kurthia zopfii]VEI05121.1 Uncharacterised protein [Kurthia zopfii]GEK30618.1 hypothetical protein KZO01_09270 [Kurthia zopfii]
MSKKVIAAIVAAVVVLVGGGVGAYFYITNTPKNAYLLSEQKSFESLNKYFSERYKNELKLADEMADDSYNGSVTLGAELSEGLISTMGIPESMVNSSKIEISAAHDPKNKSSQFAINPTIADSEIGNMSWSADKEFQYIEAPILPQPLKFKNNEIIAGIEKLTGEKMEDTEGLTNETLNLNTIMSSSITKDDMDKIVEHYLKFVIENIDEDLFKKDKGQVEVLGNKQKLNNITLDMKDSDVKKLIIAVLKEAKDDKDLAKIFEKSDASIDYKKELEKVIKDAEKAENKDFPAIKSVIYVDGKDILKREMTITADGEITKFDLDTKIDKEIDMALSISAKDAANFATIKGTSKGNKDFKDDYTLTINDEGTDATTINLTNDEKVDGDKRTNDLAVKFASGSEEYAVNYKQDMTTDVKNNNQKSSGTVSFDVQGETVKIFVDTKTKVKEALKVDVPEAQDVNQMSDKELQKVKDEVSQKVLGLFMAVQGGL